MRPVAPYCALDCGETRHSVRKARSEGQVSAPFPEAAHQHMRPHGPLFPHSLTCSATLAALRSMATT
jgi:hypothetical protein